LHELLEWHPYSEISGIVRPKLPPETSEHTRLLAERILIAVGSKLFPNTIYAEKPVLDKNEGLTLKNKKIIISNRNLKYKIIENK
jgi:hypothetical protein